jgi:hypothetical protein
MRVALDHSASGTCGRVDALRAVGSTVRIAVPAVIRSPSILCCPQGRNPYHSTHSAVNPGASFLKRFFPYHSAAEAFCVSGLRIPLPDRPDA